MAQRKSFKYLAPPALAKAVNDHLQKRLAKEGLPDLQLSKTQVNQAIETLVWRHFSNTMWEAAKAKADKLPNISLDEIKTLKFGDVVNVKVVAYNDGPFGLPKLEIQPHKVVRVEDRGKTVVAIGPDPQDPEVYYYEAKDILPGKQEAKQ